MSPKPLFEYDADLVERGAVRSNTSGKKTRTAWPKMIGSLTFIIVALRWTEKSTSSALARAICSREEGDEGCLAHHRGVDDLAREDAEGVLEHGRRAVGGDVLDFHRSSPASTTDFSLEKKSSSPIVATVVLESAPRRPSSAGGCGRNP